MDFKVICSILVDKVASFETSATTFSFLRQVEENERT